MPAAIPPRTEMHVHGDTVRDTVADIAFRITRQYLRIVCHQLYEVLFVATIYRDDTKD